MVKYILIALLTFSISASFAQSRRKKKADESQVPQPTTLDPSTPQKEYAPRKSPKKSKGPTYESEQQYYERMAQLEKTRRKNEKLQSQPQYSDPMYFGHKKPPKKRKPSKMRYCKECGIRH